MFLNNSIAILLITEVFTEAFCVVLCVSMLLVLKLSQLISPAARAEEIDPMIRIGFHTMLYIYPWVGSFTCLKALTVVL